MSLNNLIDFDYDLPEHLIALEPKHPRTASKLLVYSKGELFDSQFKLLCKYLKPNDRLIFNDTKVLNARLLGERKRFAPSGKLITKIETLLVERTSDSRWLTFCKPLKRLKISDQIVFSNSLSAEVISKKENECVLQFSKSGTLLDQAISKAGQLPLPPYIIKKRSYQTSDDLNYQSIFAREIGSIASPTASLHFDKNLLNKLRNERINFSFVTLHVGAGTFLPVDSEKISDHKMHYENGLIDSKTVYEINKTKAQGGRIIPVGTTSLRLIETATVSKNVIAEFNGKTDIFIRPGYKFKLSDGLITNFHFPKSTLLMLVSAFIGDNERKRIYQHAIRNQYRFFSYGDSSLLIP